MQHYLHVIGYHLQGVRDMLKLLFGRLQNVPAVVNVSVLKQTEAVENVRIMQLCHCHKINHATFKNYVD